MSSERQSFDEYWSRFLLRSRPFGRNGLGVLRALVTALATQRGQRRRELRWAAAAALVSWGKLLAGTLEQEIAEALRSEAAKWPPLEAVAALRGKIEPPSSRPASPAWAVWM